MQGRNIIVTGCNSDIGIGWATALACAEAGANVMVTDCVDDHLSRLVELLVSKGVKAASKKADIRDQPQVNAVVQMTVNEFGTLDGLVNNAGSSEHNAPFLDCSSEMLEFNLDVNFRGAWYFCKAALPYMQARNAAAIVNVASVIATRPVAGWAPYIAAKNATIGMSKAIAMDFAANNIRCNVVCPGAIKTELAQAGLKTAAEQMAVAVEDIEAMSAERSALGRWATAREPAELIRFLLSEKASFITGSVIEVGGGVVQGL